MSKVDISMNITIEGIEEKEVDTMWWRFQSFVNGFKTEHKPRAFNFSVSNYGLYDNMLTQPATPSDLLEEESPS